MKRKGFFVAVVSMIVVVYGPLQAQVSFFQPPQYAGNGSALFVADFNGDGKPDLLNSDGAMNLGNGDGTFTPGTSVSGSSLPVLAVADFNGDGKADLLEQGTGTLLVLLGNGDGTFQSPVSTPSGSTLTAVIAVDLNGDGRADVVGIFNSFLFVYINKGDGTFATGVSYSLAATSTASTVLSLGDFNGDTKTDIAVSIAGDNVAGQEIVLLGNGDGTFQAAKTSPGIYYPQYAAAGDFNGDGKLDLAINSNCDGGCLSDAAYILLGNGDGTFQAPTVAFPGAGSLAAVDVNGDGKLDLIHYAAVVQIYLGNGDSTFTIASTYLPSLAAITSNFALAVADFNLDNKPDIAAGGGIFLGLGNGAFQGIQLGSVPENPIAVATGDFDKNGTVDVVAISSDSLYVLSNNGGGQLTLTHTYSLQQPGIGVVTADLNGDGNLDFAVLGVNSTDQSWSYSVLLGNGDGSFQSPVTYPQSTMAGSVFGPDAIVVADFNNDHKVDLVVAVPEDESLAVLLGNGDGTFASPVYYYDAGNTSLLVADFNGDGKLDIAVGSGAVSSGPQTAILIGNGDGTFQPAAFPVSLQNFAAQFTADFNNDGKPDLMSPVQVALGNGDGTFTQLPVMEVQTYSFVNAIGDLNVDGKVDAMAADFGVLLGNGDGTFGNLINVPVPSTALIADMNGDRVPDVVFPFQALGIYAVGVLLNTTQVAPQPDFQVAASGFSPTPVAPGNSTTSTITITPLNGFSGSVALSCSGAPSAASCSFNPASIVGGTGTSTLTVSTDSRLAGGSYAVTVLGVSGSISHSAALTLLVESGTTADFQISATAASPATVGAGGSATSTVTVAALGGFNSAVAITCDSGVSGVTCSLSPASVTPSGSTSGTSTLTINTTTAVAPASYPITIIGTSGSTVHSIGVTLTVQSDFTLEPASGSPTSQTINAGQTASFSLAIVPTGSFTGTVDMSCAITPAVTPAPTCTLSSSSVQISGSGTQPVTVKVGTTAPVTTGLVPPVSFPAGPMPLIWSMTLLASGWLLTRNRRRLPVLAAPAIVLALAFSVGCGGSGSSSTHTTPGTPSGTYTATVTATSGSVRQNMALTVVVQ
jgi:hypothetical protein